MSLVAGREDRDMVAVSAQLLFERCGMFAQGQAVGIADEAGKYEISISVKVRDLAGSQFHVLSLEAAALANASVKPRHALP